jgi:outer membrane biosynthesis protein TonB
MEDKFFKYAVLISMALHMVLFAKLYLSKDLSLFPQKEAEMVFVKKEVEEDSQIFTHKEAPPPPPPAPATEITAEIPLASDAKPGDSTPFKPGSALGEQFTMFEHKPDKIKGLKITREVEVPMLKSEKINTPSYVTYYQIVRERIRDRAYVNYTKLSMGEVYLTFIIKSDGTLGELQILENRSMSTEFLKNVGMKSVQESAPFPPFPKDLDYPELTFNVQISFQYREGE